MSIRRWIEGALLGLMAGSVQADPCHAALARFDYEQAMHLSAAAPESAAAGLCAARAAYETGQFVRAMNELRKVESGQPPGEMRTYLYNWLTVTLRKLGHEQEAMQYGRAALAWARIEPNRQNLATALHNLAGLTASAGDRHAALALYRESIPLNPDLSERSASLNNVGLLFQAAGEWAAAESWMQAAIELNRAENHFHHLGKHLMNLGNLYRALGRYSLAQRHLEDGAALIEQAHDDYWKAVAMRYSGWLARDMGDRVTARDRLHEAERRYEATGARQDAVATRAEWQAIQGVLSRTKSGK